MESLNDSYSDQQHTSSWDSQKQGPGNGGGGSCSSNSVDTEALQPHLGGNIEQRRHYAENILRDEQVKPNGTVTITPHFRQLPNEILVRIIHYVLEQTSHPSYFEISGHSFYQLADDRYARGRQRNIYTWTLVSKQFYAIANPLLWIEPVLNIVDPSINVRRRMQQLLDGLAVTQQPLGDYVRTLVLSNSFCSDTDLLRLMPYIRHVETLTIQNVVFSHDIPYFTSNIHDFPRHCPHLTSLTLSNIFLSDATFRALGQHCHQLNDLTLKACGGLWDDMFDTLSNCPLEKIHLTDGNFEGVFPANMAMTLASFQGLTHLTLNGAASSGLVGTLASNNHNSPHAGNNKQQRTIVFWPHLKVIDLGHCNHIDDAIWIRFMQTHPHLVSVQLTHARLTDVSLDAVAVYLGDLSTLVFVKMNDISADGVRRLIQNCKGLVSASFHQCRQILAGDFGHYGDKIYSLCLGKTEMDNMRRMHNTLDNDEQHLINTTTLMHLA